MRPRRVLVIFGTRPEAVKLAPIVKAIASHPALEPIVAVTGQHQEMLTQVLALFGIEPDFDLELHSPGQSLEDLCARALQGLAEVSRRLAPDVVVVQGDTTTTFAGALAAFYTQVPVVHVEAGLRTPDLLTPFPEEGNRRLTSRLARLHLAATAGSRDNLLREDVHPDAICVTGNSVIDALLSVADRRPPWNDRRLAEAHDPDDSRSPMVLVTAHRRESWGEPLSRIAEAVRSVSRQRPHVRFVWPLHANPLLRECVEPAVLDCPNVVLTGPAAYGDFVRLLSSARVALTDSGGVQEEAPALGVPVLVTRDVTERHEAVEAGAARLVGADPARIASELLALLDDDLKHAAMTVAMSPYGDGHASVRSAAAIAALLDVGERLPEFDPTRAVTTLPSRHCSRQGTLRR